MKKIILAAAMVASTMASAHAYTLEQTKRFQDNYESKFGVVLSRGQANGILNKFQQLRDNNDNARGVIGRSRVIAEFESFGVVDLDNQGRYGNGARSHNKYWGDVISTVGVNTADVFTSKFRNAKRAENAMSIADRRDAQDRFESNDFVREIAASQIVDYTNVQRVADFTLRNSRVRLGRENGATAVYGDGSSFANFRIHGETFTYEVASEGVALGNEIKATAAAERRAEERAAAEMARAIQAAAEARAELMHEIVAIGIGNASRAADMAAEAGITIQELNDFAVANSNNILGGYIVYGFGETGTMFEYLRRNR